MLHFYFIFFRFSRAPWTLPRRGHKREHTKQRKGEEKWEGWGRTRRRLGLYMMMVVYTLSIPLHCHSPLLPSASIPPGIHAVGYDLTLNTLPRVHHRVRINPIRIQIKTRLHKKKPKIIGYMCIYVVLDLRIKFSKDTIIPKITPCLGEVIPPTI